MADQDASDGTEVHDLFYTDACGFSPNQSHLRQWLKTDSLKRVVDIFQENLHRVWSLSVLPQAVMHTAVTHDRLFCEATMEVLGRPLIEAEDSLDDLSQIAAKFLYLDALERPPRPGITEQTNHLVHYVKRKLIPALHAGFASLLGAQVINLLTAFESVAQDLWIAAVNERPKKLGSKEAVFKKWTPSFKKYQFYEFNLRDHLGDLIGEKVRWDNFGQMKDAYSLAFDDSGISGIFDDRRLNIVNETRNALVHNAGKADAKLLAAVNGTEYFPDLVEHKPVPLDGKQAGKLTNAVIECGQNLIRGVDSWLEKNPD